MGTRPRGNFIGGETPWHTRFPMTALAAAAARLNAPCPLSLRVTASTKSIPISASSAALAQASAPLVLPLRLNVVYNVHENLVAIQCGEIFCVVIYSDGSDVISSVFRLFLRHENAVPSLCRLEKCDIVNQAACRRSLFPVRLQRECDHDERNV